MHQKQRGEKLWKYLKQIAVRPNKAPANTANLARFVARPRNPRAPELPECQHTGQGELNNDQQHRGG